MSIKQGIFITFEGGEGTGKSTQLSLLANYLNTQNINNITTKEPGGTAVGQELRKLLVCGDKDKFDPIAEALLYYADRRIHLTDKIWPALNNGTWVLSDRFADSTMAYQYYGYNKRVAKDVLQHLYAITVGNFKPDLTILLDIDPQIGLARSLKKAENMEIKETRFESRELEFHNSMRTGYLEMAELEPKRFVLLNANQSIESLHQEIINVVKERYKLS
ncbi:MAG: dTMP kinase [Alphaproteobacteria bacterium]|nr:dTMP kinase [Alphaproteobacteria bacterium]